MTDSPTRAAPGSQCDQRRLRSMFGAALVGESVMNGVAQRHQQAACLDGFAAAGELARPARHLTRIIVELTPDGAFQIQLFVSVIPKRIGQSLLVGPELRRGLRCMLKADVGTEAEL